MNQVVAVMCLRADDSACRRAAAVAESVHGLLVHRGAQPLGSSADAVLATAPKVT